jgi:ribonuclease G
VEALEAESEEAEPAESTPIILPGESLAKYRHASLATPELEEEPEDADDVAISQEEAEAIEERSDELETADRILSHHVDESTTIAEEEKIEDVRNDQPVSPFVVGDIETEEEPLHSEAEIRDPTPIEALYVPSDELEEEGEPSAAADQAVSEAEGVSAAELAEDEVAARRGTLIGEAVEVTRFDAVDLDDVAAAEEAVAALEAENGGESPEDASEESRTASVREQGGRSMHRVSRRMRRRRGGNRFGQQQQQFGQGPREETPQFQAAGPGTAPAMVPVQPEARREGETRDKPERVLPSITDLLKPGQELIVQIAKEPLGQKGARITSHVALPGRYVVFMPSVNHLGVSRKVESEEERQRLKRILQAHRVGTTGGFIVRTAGEGVPEEEIAADMDFLYKLWLDIRQKAEKKPAPILLHCDLDVVQRILRDQVTEDYKAIWVDSEDMYENVLSFVQRFQPNLVTRVKMYTREAPIFDAFNITQELEKALRPKVWLKSGGYIVINQTEALVAIDINTGKYVGKSNRLEDTIVKTNTEAVKEIVRQIRLRDLGGIIVVDFIDMDERKNRQKVMQALEEAMQADKAPYKILQFNDFGLVAITRKRVKQSLERTLCAPCPYCEGAGYVKSVQTIVGEILVEAVKIRKALDRNDVLLRVHPDVARVLKASDNRYLEELEETLSRPVLVKGDPALHHEKFDLG